MCRRFTIDSRDSDGRRRTARDVLHLAGAGGHIPLGARRRSDLGSSVECIAFRSKRHRYRFRRAVDIPPTRYQSGFPSDISGMVHVVTPHSPPLTLAACHRFTGRLTQPFWWRNLTLCPSNLGLAEYSIAMFGCMGSSTGSTGGQTSVPQNWWISFRFFKHLLAWTEAVPPRDAAHFLSGFDMVCVARKTSLSDPGCRCGWVQPTSVGRSSLAHA
jgi:hypothetical protein